MITENVSTLKIHKLSQKQFEREKEAGSLDDNALYLTPDEGTDTTLSIAGRAADAAATGEVKQIALDAEQRAEEAYQLASEGGGGGGVGIFVGKPEDAPEGTQMCIDPEGEPTETLPNPYPLIFKGAVEAIYNGENQVVIEIPSGVSGETAKNMVLTQTVKLEEETSVVTVTLSSGCKHFIARFVSYGSANNTKTNVLIWGYVPYETYDGAKYDDGYALCKAGVKDAYAYSAGWIAGEQIGDHIKISACTNGGTSGVQSADSPGALHFGGTYQETRILHANLSGKVRFQTWNAVFGIGTHVEIYEEVAG